jgi:hypothetical protein
MKELIYGDYHGVGHRWCLRQGSSLIPFHSAIPPTEKSRKLIETIVGFHLPNIKQAREQSDKAQPTELCYFYRSAITKLRSDVSEAFNL